MGWAASLRVIDEFTNTRKQQKESRTTTSSYKEPGRDRFGAIERKSEIMPVIQLSDEEELCEAVKNAGRKLVVLAFSSGNCGPCKLTNPRLEAMSIQMPDILFFKIDVNKADEVVEKYQIKGVPTFHFYRNGKLVYQFQGGNPDYLCRTVEELRFQM
ncbi:thioredoxin-like [Engystomops pustulosus]|uniref:thioredoxin-like n=1 Tax=Engystomops pustulosus TaxID=76066 RepID=UPI003AFA573F